MRVSVIMSTYNSEKFVAEAIKSIFSQNYKDFELIIVDDGSTDATRKILKGFKYEKIKLTLEDENRGLTRRLNEALNMAEGEYIARMDSDDISMPERLGEQVRFLDNNPDVAVVGTFSYDIDESGKIISRKVLPYKPEDIKRELIRRNPILHSSIMARREAIEKAGGYDEKFKYAQDYDLWLKISQFSKLANIPKFLIKRRFYKDMLSLKGIDYLRYPLMAKINAVKRGQYSYIDLLTSIPELAIYLIPQDALVILKYLKNVATRSFKVK